MIEKTYTNTKWGLKYNIDISYNEKNNMIEIHSSSNSFRCKFNADSLEEFISFLKYAKDYEQYDEDSDEYYNPDDLKLDTWFAEGSGYEIKNYSGNWIEIYQIPSIVEYLNEFVSEFNINGVGKDKIKQMSKDELSKCTIYKLKSLLRVIQYKPSKASV